MGRRLPAEFQAPGNSSRVLVSMAEVGMRLSIDGIPRCDDLCSSHHRNSDILYRLVFASVESRAWINRRLALLEVWLRRG